MITQYKATQEFTIEIKHILVPINADTIFTWDFNKKKFVANRDITLGSWDKNVEKTIGDTIELDEKFIRNNRNFFKHLKPTIFTDEEVQQLISDLKVDTEKSGCGYYMSVSKPEEVYEKFVRKTMGDEEWYKNRR